MGKQRWRMVLDLRPLNVWCKEHKMKCESLRSLAAMGLTPETLMFSWDLQDGFHCCGIDKDYRKYMTFRLMGELHQIASLPFGWSSSPFVFQQLMQVLTKVLRTPDLPTAVELARAPRSLPGGTAKLQVQRVGGVRRRLYEVHERPP